MAERKKATKRQMQAARTKNRIFNAAISLIEKRGYDNVTISEICKKAKVSIGAFYHYFETKGDIFNELYRRGDDYFRDYVAAALKEKNTLDRIMEYFGYYADFNVKTGIDTLRQMYNTKNKLFIKKGRHMQTLLNSIVREGQEKKEIRTDMTSEEITEFLFIAVRGLIYDWCLHEGDYSLPEAMRKYVRRLLVIFSP